jgi:D-alanyl-D-alanine carboxypeptidase (penicillin-binding protein 5/6)
MENSIFANSSGWPHPGHRMSMEDLGIISVRMITEFPDLYPIFSETHFNYKDRAPANSGNRNPLLTMHGTDWKADGLKTGHTSEAGYGLAGSALQGDRRVVFVITGMESEAGRAQEAEGIVNWAFRQFVMKTVAPKGKRLAEAPVWLGETATVGLVPAEDVTMLIPALAQDGLKAEAVFDGPIEAPVSVGQQIGELVITAPGLESERRVPLVAEADVAKGGFLVRMKAAFGRLSTKAIEAASS